MVNHYAIAIDIGTSGIRAQSYDLTTKETISTAITLRHPLPGANVVDHLHFALNISRETAHHILISTINKIIDNLDINLNEVERLSVCGNPIQLSLFNNIEIRDLAFWGDNALKEKNIIPPSRKSKILNPKILGLNINKNAKVYIPPAIKHEIGADALAMLYKSKALEKKEYSIIIDFGTNAEMALIIDEEIYTASAAAGPAIEGQNIKKGKLASPGAICDINKEETYWRMKVLNDKLIITNGDLINPDNGEIIEKSDIKANGITGTGVIAAFSLGLEDELIKDGKIKNTIYLQDDVYLNQDDISNIGKALGAFRAGQLTLSESADILIDEIENVYMAGASGFYVDAEKSLNIGQIPPCPSHVYQIGNTSLAMAKDIVLNPELLNTLQKLADKLENNHVMLATSKIFEKIYSLELAIYDQGMPFWMYNQWLQKYDIQEVPNIKTQPEITKLHQQDIGDLGKNNLKTIDIQNTLTTNFNKCIYCMACVNNCPENALSLEKKEFKLRTDLCSGLGCLRCVQNCKENAFKYEKFYKEMVII
ncbi:methylamine methyltransferase corrinoid protein reductive activase [uncultured Methanobrevibacter sp.]|uniref:methylamine methyltransferase corrinoid protein reductive activase n=1 Tax=uncultured Methanobrevibacter sp. TaxID=253161 RepID=UPI00260C543F|nr:methylamine methyltransferase corrinoid protein reductive activase [uncultured Methanobrevibacter sp.]